MDICNEDLLKRMKKQVKLSKREFELLELIFVSGYPKCHVATIMGISEQELYRKLNRMEKKFPGLKDRIKILQKAPVGFPREYRQSDLAELHDENGEEITQLLDDNYVYLNGKWQKVIKRF